MDGDYGSGLYGDGLYGSGSVTATSGYGSGLYGAGPYGLAASGNNNLFGPPAKNPKQARKPRTIDRATTDDDEAAIGLVLALL